MAHGHTSAVTLRPPVFREVSNDYNCRRSGNIIETGTNLWRVPGLSVLVYSMPSLITELNVAAEVNHFTFGQRNDGFLECWAYGRVTMPAL